MSDKNLGWGSRLALIDHYKATDEQAATAFGVPVEEIETARELRESGGAVNMPVDIDVEEYGNPFEAIKGATSVKMPTKRNPAESATRVETTSKKRGRKGTKIVQAFTAVTPEPVPFEDFVEQHGVSPHVLRQSKRFDSTGIEGRVRVKKIDGELKIYRETD